VNARELLAAATPRPWHVENDHALGPDVMAEDGTVIAVDIESGESKRTDLANAELIVRAVNEYEALLTIADAARYVQTIWDKSPTASRTSEELQLDDALAKLDEVRGV
jgi:hypothetical protein